MDDVPFAETRLIIGRMLHAILRLGANTFPDLAFMECVEILVILTTIYIAEREAGPLTASSLSVHLGMPRTTLLPRLAYLTTKEIVRRDDIGLHINPQMFEAPIRDESIRRLRQIIFEYAAALSRVDTYK